MSAIWVGVLLIIVGVLFTARQALRSGRLSSVRRSGAGGATLEPPRPGAGLGLRSNWLGLLLIGAGIVVLLAETFI